MTTNQIGIRNSNIIVPYTAATKRSKQVDITFTGSNLATILMAKAIFYADSAGAWRMRFNIAYTATATAVSETITLTNISTAGLAASQVFSATNSTAAQSVLYSVVSAASPAVMSVAFSATTSSNREFSGDIALGAEPTAYTTAANMEGVLPVDVYIPPVSSGVAGIFPALNTELDNVTATRLGLKQYVHGTTYNGGNAPTVTLFAGGGTLSSISNSSFIPYQLQDGSWRIRISVYAIVSSAVRTVTTFSINGMTFGATEAGFGFISTTVALQLYTTASDSKINCDHTSATNTQYAFSGDFKLASKPTWAY